MRVLTSLIIAASLACIAEAAVGPWEWVGIWNLEEEEVYTWSAVRSAHGEHIHTEDGEHLHPHMKMVVYPVTKADHDGIHDVDEQVEQLWNSSLTVLDADTSPVLPLSSGVALDLDFSTLGWLSLFHFNVTKKGSYAFFCEHSPLDFETSFHFFKDDHGNDVEPVFVETHDDHEETPESFSMGLFALAVGGSFLTTAPSTVLILLTGPWLATIGPSIISRFTPFASGAIAGTAVFLILPEAWELLGAGGEDGSGTRNWGISILLGWLFSVAIHHAVSVFSPEDHQHSKVGLLASQSSKVMEIEGEGEGSQPQPASLAVALPVLLGDAIHGVVDGVVIGLGARTCGAELTWSIILATFGHETPQELGAFLVLVTEAKMTWTSAMFWNFLAGQACVPGAIAGFFIDFSSWSQGLLLGAGGGIFLFVGFSELLPQILHLRQKSFLESLWVIATFVIGAGLISLFVGHVHCGGHDGHDHGGHDGHDHGH